MNRSHLSVFFFVCFLSAADRLQAQLMKRQLEIRPEWQAVQRTFGPSGEFRSLNCSNCGVDQESNLTAVWSHFSEKDEVQDVKLQDAVWAEIPFWELAAIDTLFLKENHNDIRLTPLEQKKISGTRIEVRLLRFAENRWEKLISARLEISAKKISRTGTGIPDAILSQPNSVFSTGTWVKIGITKTGVYQISTAQLNPLGLNLEGKSSARIRMFGSGGKQLSEGSKNFDFGDIKEIPIQIEDGGDGVFHQNDRILFFAEEPNLWLTNKGRRTYELQNNIYSDSSYYFLTLSADSGKRVSYTEDQPVPDVFIHHYPERWFYGPDNVNVLALGRVWYSDVFDFNTNKTISFQTSDLSPDSVFRIRYGLMARSGAPYPFRFSVNGSQLADTIPATVNIGSSFGAYGRDLNVLRYFKPAAGTSSLNLSISYLKAGNPESIGYLNFIEATGWRQLQWQEQGFGFRSFDHIGKNACYVFSGLPSDARVWDVSDRFRLRQLPIRQDSMLIHQDTIKEFFAFSPSSLPVPAFFTRMPNQNLRALSTPDLLIVSNPALLSQAYRLADFRRNHDGLDVEVVTTQQVYNEFSSGTQDITAIRNFAMHLYYKDPGTKLKYLLLVGDCSYDYKNRIENNTNLMPTYESPASLSVLASYASDDYFGILGRNKNGWESLDLMDIGVGRLPAKDIGEAQNMVNKLIHYASSPKTLGNWRNRYTFVADNGDYCEHSRQSNELSEALLSRNKRANVKKLFIGAYERIAGAGGYTSPAATNELISSIESGNLIVNYTGHGGATVWADEFLFTREMIEQLRNYDRLTFFVTATCDFGRHDNPGLISGAESLLLNDKGGAVGIMTTGRPVGSANNYSINQSFYQNLFNLQNGRPGRMGDAIREAKNKNADKASNRGFTLLGDPSASFAFPEQEIEVTEIPDTIRGLDFVEIKGQVLKEPGVVDTDFDGQVYATLFDRPGMLSIIDGEPCSNTNYPNQRSALFNGNTAVNDGLFSFKFFVSADVSYLKGSGRLSLYADNPAQVKDAAGFQTNLTVGGFNPNPIDDSNGPEIALYMNDFSFVDYGLTDANPDLLVLLNDPQSGINASGLGLGHDLTAILDDNQTFVLNDYFENTSGSFQTGSIRFPLRDLSPGLHNIKVRVWDNFNNSSVKEINFEVGGANYLVKNLQLYPNPFSDKAFIRFESAMTGQQIRVGIEVLNLAGKMLHHTEYVLEESVARPGASGELVWDGRNSDGTRLAPGAYFCRIRVKSDTTNAEEKFTRKLFLIH